MNRAESHVKYTEKLFLKVRNNSFLFFLDSENSADSHTFPDTAAKEKLYFPDGLISLEWLFQAGCAGNVAAHRVKLMLPTVVCV